MRIAVIDDEKYSRIVLTHQIRQLLLGHACLGPELPYTVFHGLSPLSINVKGPSREASFT